MEARQAPRQSHQLRAVYDFHPHPRMQARVLPLTDVQVRSAKIGRSIVRSTGPNGTLRVSSVGSTSTALLRSGCVLSMRTPSRSKSRLHLRLYVSRG